MPNWVKNRLYVSGSQEDIERFKKEAAGENGCLDMDSFIPMPLAFKNQIKINTMWTVKTIKESRSEGRVFSTEEISTLLSSCSNVPGKREWCSVHWGSSYNFCDLFETAGDDNLAGYGFETAWEPPIRVIFKMAERFPMLMFELRYVEEGLDFYGLLVVDECRIVVHISLPDSATKVDHVI